MLGSHLSIAGSLASALREAESLKLETVQVFTKNQQQWRVPPLKPDIVKEWHTELARLAWQGRTVAHASYLMNLASPDRALWKKSVALMREEIERCETLGIAFLVHHPGAFTTSTLDEGLARIADAYAQLFAATRGYRTISCLENTAGGGSTIGRIFEDLANLRALILQATGADSNLDSTTGSPGKGARIGFCFDTCHAHAAGYDMSSFDSATRSLDEFDRLCGLPHVRVLHLNDSKGALNSRLDRHEHIGKGQIGLGGFAAVLHHPAVRAAHRPMIMETPKGITKSGTQWDTLNLRRLRKLQRLTAPVSIR